MDILIPDTVQFVSGEDYWRNGHTLCFRHAVLRAIAGEEIRIMLINEDYYTMCADCIKEKES